MSTYFVLLPLFYDALYFVVMDRYVNNYPGNKEFRVLNVLNEILHRDYWIITQDFMVNLFIEL